MEKIKYTPKELKQPDKFTSFIITLVDKAEKHFKKIIYGFVIALLALTTVVVIGFYQDKKSDSAGAEFAKALELYNSGNAEEAISRFSDIFSKYPNEQSAKLSMYYSATIYYDSEQYEKSIEKMQTYLDSNPDSQTLKDSGNLIVGLAYYNLQKWEDAARFLSRIDGSNSLYKKSAKVNLALAYEKMGDDQKAAEIYKLILSDTADPEDISYINIQELSN